MDIRKTKSLVELFFKKLSDNKDNKKSFLERLNSRENQKYNWNEVSEKILTLSSKIKSMIEKGDRCLLLSENRPEWLIADIAIMNAGGITVPVFTTYAKNDYEYIINDCNPSLVIVSNNEKFEKIKEFIKEKKIVSFEKIKTNSLITFDIYKEN